MHSGNIRELTFLLICSEDTEMPLSHRPSFMSLKIIVNIINKNKK